MKNNNIYVLEEYIINYVSGINLIEILDDLGKVRHHNNIIDESTLSPLVKALRNAYLGAQSENHFNSPDKVTHYETLLQKELYFDQELINTEQEFDDLFERLNAENGLLFRGLPEAKFALYSKAQRTWIEQKLNEKYAIYEDFLNSLLANAREENNGILSKYLKTTGFYESNDLTVFSFLQHYGCPTPLLDWSANFQVALYFATLPQPDTEIKKYIDKYCAVYYIGKKYLEETSVNKIMYDVLKENEEFLKDAVLKELRKFMIISGDLSSETIKQLALSSITPSVIAEMSKISHLIHIPMAYLSEVSEQYPLPNYLLNNFNIISQEGSFTWSNDPVMPLEVAVRRENSKSEAHADNLLGHCININKKLNNYIQKKLTDSGVVKDIIYPDLKGLADSICKKTIEKRHKFE